MPRHEPATLWISDPRQIRALASPLRQEIIDAAAARGTPVSIAELADALARPADRLYFHVRQLTRVGLLVEAGQRREGRHVAALYRLPADRLRLRYKPQSARAAQGITAVVEGVLRLARRDFRKALASRRAVLEGPDRDLWGGRTRGWLTPPEQRRLNELIERIDALLREARPRRGARPVAFTFVRVPLDAAVAARRPRTRRTSP